MNPAEDVGTLRKGECHPSSYSAMCYIKEIMSRPASLALSDLLREGVSLGIRNCEICLATWDRIATGEPVSDRYLLGLAWFLKGFEEFANERDI